VAWRSRRYTRVGDFDAIAALTRLEQVLDEPGHRVDLSTAVGAAQKVLAEVRS
jgi:hypothetical protein